MINSKQIVSKYISELMLTKAKQQVLLLNFAKPKILDIQVNVTQELQKESEFDKISNQKFDLIIGDLPYGMHYVAIDGFAKIPQNWAFVVKSLRSLNNEGQAFFLIEPGILFSVKGRSLLEKLESEGYYYNAVFEVPEKILYPKTLLQPIIVQFERKKQDKLFIGEITNDFLPLINNFHSRTETNQLSMGLLVEKEYFTSFNKLRTEKELNALQTQYKEYVKYQLKEIATINNTRTIFQPEPNSIYIPCIGTSAPVVDITKTTIKQHNLFQVVLNPQIVQAEFLEIFFRSELGKLSLKSFVGGNFIPKINKSDIGNCLVPIPSISEQSMLILADKKLSEMQHTAEQMKTELGLNPQSANFILNKLENIHLPLEELSENAKILDLIRTGENKRIEFKQIFSKTEGSGSYKVVETIVAFLNTEGGTILVGIADDGAIIGLEEDKSFTTTDKFLLTFKNVLKESIDSDFMPLIE